MAFTTLLMGGLLASPPIEAPTGDSNRMPDGGYILPAIPSVYLRNPVNTAARFAPLDAQLESVRARYDAWLDSLNVRKAVGSDLEALGRRVGVYRAPGEGDSVYRTRIPATCQQGVGAISQPLMAAYLQQITNGIPVTIYDDAQPGAFHIMFIGYPPQGAAIVPLILAAKPLGFSVSIVARNPSVKPLRIGTKRIGEAVIGGNSYITLLAMPVWGSNAATGAKSRIGTKRIGTVRIGE